MPHEIIVSLCRLIVCQRISHIQAEKIWNELQGKLVDYKKHKELFEKRLGEKKAFAISSALAIKCNDLNTGEILAKISKIKGVGPWTIKWLENEYGNEKTEFLYEDLEVRKGLAKLLGVYPEKISIQQAKEYGETIPSDMRAIASVNLIELAREIFV